MSQLLDPSLYPPHEPAPVADAPSAAGAEHPAVEVRGLRKMFTRSNGEVVAAVNGTDLDIAHGEFLVLLGPSGCGKSTLLRCVAGLEKPQLGTVRIDGRLLFDGENGVCLPPERRGISMVFQSYALWPHMNVFKNVAYPITVGSKERLAKAEVARRVGEVLELVGIGHLADQYPSQISGGQQQRVALARALVQGSDVVLFDEPLSNVDARVRDQLRTEIKEMQQRLGFTAIYVTHDQEEALSLADRIAVIDSGTVVQLGSPREVFLAPATLGVGRFLGNLVEIEGTVTGLAEDRVTLSTELGDIVGRPAAPGLSVGDTASATWRPDRTVLDAPAGQENTWSGEVSEARFMGAFTEVSVRIGDQPVSHRCAGDREYAAGSSIRVRVAPDDVRVLV